MTEFPHPRKNCAVCNKEVIVMSTRDTKIPFCGRVCASNYKYGKRYNGGTQADKPNMAYKRGKS